MLLPLEGLGLADSAVLGSEGQVHLPDLLLFISLSNSPSCAHMVLNNYWQS